MSQATASMICPKCGGTMRTYERSGVTVDQCTDCRGLFLDRGELERLMAAEDQHYGAQEQRQSYPDQPPAFGRGSREHGGYSEHDQRRRKRGFLGELFD